MGSVNVNNEGDVVYFEIVEYSGEAMYIFPCYINRYPVGNWERQNTQLIDVLNNFDTNRVMIIGDLNGRIGSLEPYLKYKGCRRQSKDREINQEGKKIIELCDSFGLAILNGSTVSDNEGNFTFIGHQGFSINDYCLAGLNWCEIVQDMEVKVADFSDHLPLSIVIKLNINIQNDNRKRNIAPRIKWHTSIQQYYNTSFEIKMNEINYPNIENIDEE